MDPCLANGFGIVFLSHAVPGGITAPSVSDASLAGHPLAQRLHIPGPLGSKDLRQQRLETPRHHVDFGQSLSALEVFQRPSLVGRESRGLML